MPKLMEKRYCYSKEKAITLWQEKWFYSKSYFFLIIRVTMAIFLLNNPQRCSIKSSLK